MPGRRTGRRGRARTAARRSSARSRPAEPGDVVVIAGKGHEQGQEIAGDEAPVRRPRGRARGAPRDGGCARDPAPARRRSSRSARRARAGCDATRSTGVQIDSRRIEPGDLFVAVGSGGDVRRATRSRAAAPRRSCPTTRSPRSRRSAGPSAPAARARVVGDHRLDRQDVDEGHPRRALRAARAHGRRRGEPQQRARPAADACRLEPDTEICVVEMGMRGLGQIAELCAIARPDVGVITTIGPVHLELVGTVEESRARRRSDRRRCPPAASRSSRRPAELEPLPARATSSVRRFDDASTSSCATDGGARRRSAAGRLALHRSPRATRRRTCSPRCTPTTRSACRSSAPARAPRRSQFSPLARRGATASRRRPRRSTTPTTRTRSRCAAALATRRARGRRAARRGARRDGRARRRTARATTREIGRARAPSSASRSSSRSASSRAATAAERRGRPTPTRGARRPREALDPPG